jgi:formamidopyrimidine-DNA glycosylase
MPEGDTLHTLALAIRPRLAGEPIEALRLRDRGEVEAVRGHPIDAVEGRQARSTWWCPRCQPAPTPR